MKSIASTVSILMAAGLTIGAIAAVSAASAQTSKSSIYTKGGYVETPTRTISSSAVTTTRTYVAPSAATTIVRNNAVPLTSFRPSASGVAAIALGPAPSTPVRPLVGAVAQTPSDGTCARGRAAQPFTSQSINFRGVTYRYTPTPPIMYTNGAAIAAIFPAANGQSEICYSGACVSGAAGTCAAIAVAQPNGRARIYVQ